MKCKWRSCNVAIDTVAINPTPPHFNFLKWARLHVRFLTRWQKQVQNNNRNKTNTSQSDTPAGRRILGKLHKYPINSPDDVHSFPTVLQTFSAMSHCRAPKLVKCAGFATPCVSLSFGQRTEAFIPMCWDAQGILGRWRFWIYNPIYPHL